MNRYRIIQEGSQLKVQRRYHRRFLWWQREAWEDLGYVMNSEHGEYFHTRYHRTLQSAHEAIRNTEEHEENHAFWCEYDVDEDMFPDLPHPVDL